MSRRHRSGRLAAIKAWWERRHRVSRDLDAWNRRLPGDPAMWTADMEFGSWHVAAQLKRTYRDRESLLPAHPHKEDQ
ncbi:hypothetical protein ACQP1V_36390 [Microtetraspora malaysiensis]|uniref:hypothetical protein n=1 Tax=Microtetraspora malaysiensis TaxID=161358 RepID=UPI003D909CF0